MCELFHDFQGGWFLKLISLKNFDSNLVVIDSTRINKDSTYVQSTQMDMFSVHRKLNYKPNNVYLHYLIKLIKQYNNLFVIIKLYI